MATKSKKKPAKRNYVLRDVNHWGRTKVLESRRAAGELPRKKKAA